ncbi:MAG: protein phosphatase 2C domain-containing protein [Bacteroidia bacterium]
MNIQIFPPQGLSETGGRPHNEDAIFPAPEKCTESDRLFIVCDGVGGANKGEIASQMVVEGFSRFFAQNPPPGPANEGYINHALRQTETQMSWYLSSHPECANMATTLTLLYLDSEGALVAWAGDSRIYQFRSGKCIFKSRDHSLVAELVKQGKITEEEAETHPRRNVILRAVKGSGGDATEVDVRRLSDIQPGDIFFLCSDGINEQWNEARLGELFGSAIKPEQMKGRIKARSEGNTKDNFSCYLVQIQSIGEEKKVASSPPKSQRTKTLTWIAAGAVLLMVMIMIFRGGKSPQDLSSTILTRADSLIVAQKYEQALVWFDSLQKLTPEPSEEILKKSEKTADSLRNIISIEKEAIEDLGGRADAAIRGRDYIQLLETESALTDFIETHRKNPAVDKIYDSIKKAVIQKEQALNPKEQVSLITAEMETFFNKNNCDQVKLFLMLAKEKAGEDPEARAIISEKESSVKSCN